MSMKGRKGFTMVLHFSDGSIVCSGDFFGRECYVGNRSDMLLLNPVETSHIIGHIIGGAGRLRRGSAQHRFSMP